MIFNYSSYKPSKEEKNLLAKGLNFALPPKILNYGDYFIPFELLYCNIKNLPLNENILERIKVDLKMSCYSSFDNYEFENELNITKEQLAILKLLAKREDIIIQKADQGNSVILNKCNYLKIMKEMLSDCNTFLKK